MTEGGCGLHALNARFVGKESSRGVPLYSSASAPHDKETKERTKDGQDSNDSGNDSGNGAAR